MSRVPTITVAIPTIGRADLIDAAIASVLSQTRDDFILLVIDNSRDDSTQRVISTFGDSRIEHVKTAGTLDAVGAWNQCVELCKTEYLLILGDDDRLRPTFLHSSLAVHEREKVGFTFTHAAKVSPDLEFIRLWGYEFFEGGGISGSDYLKRTLTTECCLTLASTVVIPIDVYRAVGPYKTVYAYNTFDFNLYLRIALNHDVYFVDEVLVDYRLHDRQLSEEHWRTDGQPTGKLATYLELIGVASQLITSRACDDTRFLAERLDSIARHCAGLLRVAFPSL